VWPNDVTTVGIATVRQEETKATISPHLLERLDDGHPEIPSGPSQESLDCYMDWAQPARVLDHGNSHSPKGKEEAQEAHVRLLQLGMLEATPSDGH
jgi:hypothetical protein